MRSRSSVARQLALADDALAIGECLLEVALDEVRPAPDDSPLVWREFPHTAEKIGERTFSAKMRDPPLL